MNLNKKIMKSELKIDIQNTKDSSNNRYNSNKIINEMKSNNQKNNITNSSISLNNLSGINSQEKFFQILILIH